MSEIPLTAVSCLILSVSTLAAADERPERAGLPDQPLQRLVVPEDANGNTDTISDMAFSADGKMLAVAYGKFVGLLQEPSAGQMIVWDVKRGKRIVTLRSFGDGVSSVAFSGDGGFIAAGSYDGTVQLWSSGDWRRTAHTRASRGAVTSLDFCSKGDVLAVGTWQGREDKRNNTINLYQASNAQPVSELKGHTDGVLSVQFSPGGEALISSSMDGTVRLWNIKRGTDRVLHESDSLWFYSVAFSPDGKLAAAGGGDLHMKTSQVRIWDTSTWEMKSKLSEPERPLRSICFLHDRKWIATASTEGRGKLWSLSEERTRQIAHPSRRIRLAPNGKVLAAASDRVVLLSGVEQLFDK